MPALAPPPRLPVVRRTPSSRRKAVPPLVRSRSDLHSGEEGTVNGFTQSGGNGSGSSNGHTDSIFTHSDRNRDLPPLPSSSVFSSSPASPSAQSQSPHQSITSSMPSPSSPVTAIRTANQNVHYVRAARANSPAAHGAFTEIGDGMKAKEKVETSPTPNSFTSGGSDVGLQAGIFTTGDLRKGLGISLTQREDVVDRPPSQTIERTQATLQTPGESTTIPNPKPTDILNVIKGVVPQKKPDNFSVDDIPDHMRLWEASRCLIKDERGKSRRFGDFWDDMKNRGDSMSFRTTTTPSMTRQSTASTGTSEAISSTSSQRRRESSATVESNATRSSINGMTSTATETSGYRSEYGRRSPSLGSLYMEDDPEAGPSTFAEDRFPFAFGDASKVELPSNVTPSLLRTNTSHSTIRKSSAKASGSIKSDVKKIGGEEWIVMGRKTVVFWIRTFICGQCQDYTFASLSQLDPVAIHEAGINVIIIAPGSWKIIKRYREIFKCPFPIYVDDSRRLYQLMGMTRLSGDFGPAKGRAAYHQSGIPRQILKGIGNSLFKMPLANPGKISQLGGEFVLGPGIQCDFAHRMTTRSDHMEAPAVLQHAGCDGCTLPEQQVIELAQAEIEDLERMHSELEAWQQGRETELERIKRKKSERRGLNYGADLRRVNNDLSVPIEEGPDLEGDMGASDSGRVTERRGPPLLPLEEGLGDGRLSQLESQLNEVESG